MNAQHLRAVVWLRWRLRVNQLKRGGTANAVIMGVLAVLGLILAVGLFIGGFLIGYLVLGEAPPVVLLLVWDGLAGVFLFFWLIGLMTELQRSEVLSLDKFLHLPVTLTGVFLINYFSSLVRLSLIVFGPAMIGLSLGLVFSRGPAMLWLFLLLAAFLLMVTALTYQFQGWLASLMANPRRRRTIIVALTVGFVLLAQAPNLINMWIPRERGKAPPPEPSAARKNALKNQLEHTEITITEYRRLLAEIEKEDKARAEQEVHEELQAVGRTAQIISAVAPPGWLPLGAMAAAEGGSLTPLLATLGLSLIGSVSLWRAYRTTIRLYTGQFTANRSKAALPAAKVQVDGRLALLERRLPGISEHASAVAMASFRSLVRAPEAKMLLLTPVIMVIVFGSMLITRGSDMTVMVRPLVAFGAMAMTLLSFVQLVGNQFGFDRTGFRVYVLSPAPRRDILLGKNLAIAPLALGIGWLMTLFVQIVRPLRVDHFLAVAPQSLSMFLIFCLMANLLSITSPMPVAAGSLRPAHPRGALILLQLAFMLAFPIAMSPTLLPLAVEALLPAQGWLSHLPACLILSLIECGVIVVIYQVVLTSQGALLHAREKKILEVVTAKAE